MSTADAPRHLVRREDVEVLIGIAAIMDSHMKGGAVDEGMVAQFAARFVNAGLLEPQGPGGVPSAGRVAVALDDLIQRLRFAVGEYDTEPEPAPPATEHVLTFPTATLAENCKAELSEGALRVLMEPDEGGSWRLLAAYPELAPDPDFQERERSLQATARSCGGKYSGSQGPPG